MKVVHLCLACFYFDNSTYQENLISKYHKKLGYDVEIIAPPIVQNEGKLIIDNKYRKYTNENGIPIIRLPYRGPIKLARKLCVFKGIKQALCEAAPDVLFIHGLQSLSVKETVSFIKKNPSVKVYVDNHVDFYNSAKNFVSLHILHKGIWRHSAKLLTPYANKFYGVLPARVSFLTDVYKIPREKVELLVLGVDDDLLDEVQRNESRKRIRDKYRIDKDSCLIVTGGKINKDRPETIKLMEAINIMNRSDVRLLVFGNPSKELKHDFAELIKSKNIIYAGWASTKEIYEYFVAGDLIAFPGLHSVLWEQAVGSGCPCIFKKIEGFEHVDLGGNCTFFNDNTVEGMIKQITEIVDKNLIADMKKNALRLGKDYFSYKNIAEQSIQ